MTPVAERNQRRTTPVNYLAAMAVLMVVSAWLAVSDRLDRADIEHSVLPTALGDRHWHSSGPEDTGDFPLGEPMAYYLGKPLYPQSRVTRETVARTMLRVGETDHGGYTVYQATGKLAEAHEGWYLMVGTVPGRADRGLFRPVAHSQKYRSDTPGAADQPSVSDP